MVRHAHPLRSAVALRSPAGGAGAGGSPRPPPPALATDGRSSRGGRADHGLLPAVGEATPQLRVLTCNLKGRCRDNTALDDLIRSARPDIVALQGCWGDVRVAWPETWHVCRQGELLIASRVSPR